MTLTSIFIVILGYQYLYIHIWIVKTVNYTKDLIISLRQGTVKIVDMSAGVHVFQSSGSTFILRSFGEIYHKIKFCPISDL
jgi:hypothetical protein